MAKKINQKQEKRAANEAYAKKFEKDKEKKTKLGIGKNWCRILENNVLHPQSCNCNLPDREELIALSRRR
jgi:hypothetical protein